MNKELFAIILVAASQAVAATVTPGTDSTESGDQCFISATDGKLY